MIEPKLARLTRLDPKVVWQHEARDFTPWLADNIALLNDALGLEIEFTQREVSVGDFAVDIFGKEVGSGREVIIENQLEPTDHTHLGQLLTYAAGLEAKIVIWISPQFRDEHRQAVDWLNMHSTEDVSFFGIELDLFQIGDSLPAPHFKVAAQPSEWQRRATASTKAPYSDRQLAYHDFFVDLLNRLKARSPAFTASKRVGYDSWVAFGSGRSGFGFNPVFGAGKEFRVELYIDTGSYELNKLAFDQLHDDKEQIEEAVGDPLTWERLDHRRACRLYVQREGSIDSPPETLDGFKDWAIDRLVRFKEVFSPRIRALTLQSSEEAQP